MNLPVAILAGGKATRLYPVTRSVPKSLLEIAGRPFLFHQLERLREGGVRRVVICSGYLGSQIRKAVGGGRRFGLSVEQVSDGAALLGTGGALLRHLPSLGEAFLVLYGDSYLEIDYAAAARIFLESGRLGLMTVFRNAGRWDRSNVHFARGRILAYDKRNPAPAMQHIDYGLGAFHAAAFAGFTADAPLDLADVYRRLIDAGQLAGLEVTRRFYEIGSPPGLEETRAYLKARQGPEKHKGRTQHGNQRRTARQSRRRGLRAQVSD